MNVQRISDRIGSPTHRIKQYSYKRHKTYLNFSMLNYHTCLNYNMFRYNMEKNLLCFANKEVLKKYHFGKCIDFLYITGTGPPGEGGQENNFLWGTNQLEGP